MHSAECILFLDFRNKVLRTRLSVNLSHVGDEFENLVGVADFVVVPRNNLHERVGESDTSLSVEDRRAGVAEEVAGNDCVFRVAEYAFEFAFRSLLHSGADFSVSSGLSEVHREVNNRNVKSRNAHRHTGEFAVEFGDNLTYSLSSTRRRGDDVAAGSATAAPVLHRGTVYGLLRSRGGVNRRHEAVGDTELVVKHLSDRSKAVGGAGSVRNELSTLNVLVEVYAANEHGGVVLGGSRHNNVLSTSFDVCLCLLFGEEKTRRFNYVFCFHFVPLQISRIALCSYADFLTVNDELAVLNVCLDSALELAVHGVILQHVSQVVYRAKVVDTYNLDVAAVLSGAEYETADTTETVNTYFNHDVLIEK